MKAIGSRLGLELLRRPFLKSATCWIDEVVAGKPGKIRVLPAGLRRLAGGSSRRRIRFGRSAMREDCPASPGDPRDASQVQRRCPRSGCRVNASGASAARVARWGRRLSAFTIWAGFGGDPWRRPSTVQRCSRNARVFQLAALRRDAMLRMPRTIDASATASQKAVVTWDPEPVLPSLGTGDRPSFCRISI